MISLHDPCSAFESSQKTIRTAAYQNMTINLGRKQRLECIYHCCGNFGFECTLQTTRHA